MFKLKKIEFEHIETKEASTITSKVSQSDALVGRGLHYQIEPSPQEKLIQVEDGRIIDFVYDVTQVDGVVYCYELSVFDQCTIHVPSNYAHGFITLEPTKFRYITLGDYDLANERIINILKSAASKLNIGTIQLSEKDNLSPPKSVFLI